MAKLPPENANPAILRLANNKKYMELPVRDHGEIHARIDALMLACAEIRHPHKELLDFLDLQAKPGSGQSNIVISIFAEMRSHEACKRIERRFHSRDYGEHRSKIGWFMVDLVELRNEPAIVALYERLLSSKIEDMPLRNAIVQSLFDYHPKTQFPVLRLLRSYPQPPPRREAKTEVLEQILKIADASLKLDLSADTIEGVRKVAMEIEAILEFRRSGAPERIAKLIAQLDNESFPVRDGARGELEKYGDLAEPALREALQPNISAEMRQRISNLLNKLKK